MNPQSLRIGITCFPTYGGSGIVATEIGMALARRGHQIHFISSDLPVRLDRFTDNLFFHAVEANYYPLFNSPFYTLSLASKMVEVATYQNLDILHVHYAIPHAASAYLAKAILEDKAPKVITTLHGTDITLVGTERSYLPITRFSILKSDAVTVPSRYLKQATYDKLNIPVSFEISMIPNFVNTERFHPREAQKEKERLLLLGSCSRADKILVHVSNFRPVKRIEDVIKIFAEVRKRITCHLVLIGDGPERSNIEGLVRRLGLGQHVCFLGKQLILTDILKNCDVFILPSEIESFGLAALEALSCGVPVVATNVGGLPEVVTHDEVGFLSPVGDLEAMAANVERLLSDEDLYTRMSQAARKRAVEQFGEEGRVNEYERVYRRVCEEIP